MFRILSVLVKQWPVTCDLCLVTCLFSCTCRFVGWVQNEDRIPKNEDPFKIVLKSLETATGTWFSTEEETRNINICSFQRIWPWWSSVCRKPHQNYKKTPSKRLISPGNRQNMILDWRGSKKHQHLRFLKKKLTLNDREKRMLFRAV